MRVLHQLWLKPWRFVMGWFWQLESGISLDVVVGSYASSVISFLPSKSIPPAEIGLVLADILDLQYRLESVEFSLAPCKSNRVAHGLAKMTLART
ncbi:hypothetical protein Q3G72_033314 [Acer saccharum]|nr:hypothetical protein Q3G72_033314 [Acer saccharum]